MNGLPDRIILNFKIRTHLKQFLLSYYNQEEPLFIPRKDKLMNLLSFILNKSQFEPDEGEYTPDNSIQMILPYFKLLNINSFNYVSIRSQRSFDRIVAQKFWGIFMDFVIEAKKNEMCSKKDAIILFIERYNLTESPYLVHMLYKEFYRNKKIGQIWARKEYEKPEKKSKKN